MEEKELLFVSVIGKDCKGIVARISDLLYRSDINIEDISQKIMNGYFVMIMLIDFAEASCTVDELRTGLSTIGDELSLTIQVQHENIFKMMHRV